MTRPPFNIRLLVVTIAAVAVAALRGRESAHQLQSGVPSGAISDSPPRGIRPSPNDEPCKDSGSSKSWADRANIAVVIGLALSVASLYVAISANQTARDAKQISNQSLQLTEPSVVPLVYSIAKSILKADNSISLASIQSDTQSPADAVGLIPPILTNAGTATAKGVVLTWIPTYVKSSVTDPAFWQVRDNRNAPLTIGPGATLAFPCIPGAFDSQQADKLDYVYGVLKIEFHDAIRRHPDEYYAYEINSVGGPNLYILITKPYGIKLPVVGKPYPRYFINPQAVANPAYGNMP